MHKFQFRPFSLRAAATVAKVGGAAAVTAAALLGSLAMTGGPASALGPPAGVPPVTSYSDTCSVAGVINFGVTVDFFGQAPGATHPGRSVDLHAVRSTATIPASFVNLAVGVLHLSSLNFTIIAANINATNTVEGTENTLPAPVTVNVALTAGQPASFQIPTTPATVGPWTAGSSGTITFTPGKVIETVTVFGLTLPVTCSPTSEPVLGTTVIR